MGCRHNGAKIEIENPHVPPAHRGVPPSPAGLDGLGLRGWSALVHSDDVPDLTAGLRTGLRP